MRNTLRLTALLTLLGASTSYSLPIINEVDADNPSTDTAEFVELYDGGIGNTQLDGYSLVLFNGSNDSSYQAFDLDGYTTNNEGFFVLCGNATNTENCDLDVSPDSNLIQNGADAVALYLANASDFPSGSAITTNGLIDAIAYDTNDGDDSGILALLNAGQPQVNEGGAGDKDNHSNQRCGDLIPLDTDGYLQTLPTPGMPNTCGDTGPTEPTLGACGDSEIEGFTYISQIQGSISDINNDASPLSGQTVVIEGIVTMDKQGGPLANGENSYQYSGFWVQEEDADVDGDNTTSEGVFVYNYRDAVNVGDKVRLMANVTEFNNATQLSNVTEIEVCSSDNPLPAAVTVTLPVENVEALEAIEGMLVSNQQGLVVSDLFGTGYGFGNYGQFVVSSKLHFQPTEIALPQSVEAIAAANARTLDVLLVDDGVSASYPEFIPFPDETGFSSDNPMRIGYSVPNLEGVMHGWRNNYTVIPSSLTIDPTNPRTSKPIIAQDSNLVIVGMNVLNFFNGDGLGGGFPTSRGAPSLEALEMQTQKIVAALTAMDADVIALMEIENDGYDENSAIQELVNALNASQIEGNEYSFVNPSVNAIGSDEIAVGLLYRPAKLTTIGTTTILDSSNSPLDDNGNPLFIDEKNRPSLIQSFDFQGDEFTLSVNHLKSKGSACNEPNEGQDGQANCNITRTKATQALVQFLAGNPTGIETDKVMILGDLNAYSQEDPMQVLYNNGFQNLKYTNKATEEQPFSYSFSGFLGSLDHAVASTALTADVLSVDAWHINSVEDSLVDYLTEANGQPYDSIDNYATPDAYRSSDHDPIIIALNIGNNAPEIISAIENIEVSRRQTLNVDLSIHFMDRDGDNLTFTGYNLPRGLVISEDGQLTGKVTRNTLRDLPVTVTLEVSDGHTIIEIEFEISEKENVWKDIRSFIKRFFGWLFR